MSELPEHGIEELQHALNELGARFAIDPELTGDPLGKREWNIWVGPNAGDYVQVDSAVEPYPTNEAGIVLTIHNPPIETPPLPAQHCTMTFGGKSYKGFLMPWVYNSGWLADNPFPPPSQVQRDLVFSILTGEGGATFARFRPTQFVTAQAIKDQIGIKLGSVSPSNYTFLKGKRYDWHIR